LILKILSNLVIFFKHIRTKTACNLFIQLFPLILTAQNPTNTHQAQQLLNKSNKSQFFIENKGQWPNQVKFLARLGGMNCWITDSAVVFDFYKLERSKTITLKHLIPSPYKTDDSGYSVEGCVVKMNFPQNEQSSNKKDFIGIDRLETYYNYFIGKDSNKWEGNVPVYNEILISNVLNGIDARYYFDEGKLRYDLIVKPGADPSKLIFNFEGQQSISVKNKNELNIRTLVGNVIQNQLVAYQELDGVKLNVRCEFNNNNNGSINFTTGKYNPKIPLIIDPIIFSTFLGGNNRDRLSKIVLDRNKNSYVLGITYSANYPTTSGVYKDSFDGSWVYVLSKLNSSGSSLIYSTYFGSGTAFSQQYDFDIQIDSTNNIYIAGNGTGLNTINYPVTSGAFQTTMTSNYFFSFITKFNPSGSALVFSTYLNGQTYDPKASNYTELTRIHLDQYNNIYATGFTGSDNFPLTNGAMKTSSTCIQCSGLIHCCNYAFITKLNNSGTGLIYSTYFGGDSMTLPYALDVLPNGEVLVAGYTRDYLFPTTTGTYQTKPICRPPPFHYAGNTFISKINSTGTAIIWSTLFGGYSDDIIRDITHDNNGGIYITGTAHSANLPITANAIQDSLKGVDCFISKFDSNCKYLQYSTFLGGSSTDDCTCLKITAPDMVYISGYTNSIDYPVTMGVIQQSLKGPQDIFLSKIDLSSSTLLYSTYLGGSNYDVNGWMDIDNSGNVYLTGTTGSNDFPTTLGSFSPTYNGGTEDGFVTKLDLVIQAYNVSTNNISCSQTKISWKKGQGKKRVAFVKQGNVGQPIPINKTTYTANTVFGSGSQIGSSGWYCIYNDTGTTVTVSGLLHDTTYRVMVIEDTGSIGNELFITGITNNNPINLISGLNPKASFTVNDSILCKGANFIFTNKSTTSSGTLSSVWWFGDGDSSHQQNPIHTYKISNTYDIKLVVTTGINCSDSFTKKVYMHPSPTALFSLNDSVQCLTGNNFVYTNNSIISQGSFNSNWQFGDGAGSIYNDTSHSYSYEDTFFVKLIVISDSGCKDSVAKKVYFNPTPKSKFIIYDSSQCLERNNFGFLNSSTISSGKMSYLWNFGDMDTSTKTNPFHSYLNADTFTVLLVATSDMNCVDSFKGRTYLHVHPRPFAGFSINDSSQCLLGNLFLLSNNSSIKSGLFSQYWNFGDGYDTNSYNAGHSYSIPGNYTVKLLLISDWVCKDSILKRVYIRPEPKAGFKFNNNPQFLTGNNFIYTSTSTIPSGNLHYIWDFGDGDTSTQVNPGHSYTKAGRYAVQMIVTSDYGCADTFIDTAIIRYPNIKISFTYQNACVGVPVLFTNTSTVSPPDSFLNFLWDFGDGNTIVRKHPTHIYFATGKYIVSLVVLTAFGNKDTLIDTIEVFPTPTIDITAVPDSFLIPGTSVTLNANGIFDQLLWWDNSTGQSVDVNSSGKYWVTASFTSGCKNSDTIWIIDGEKKEIEIMNVFTPNGDGYNDYFVIKDIKNYQPVKLAIYNRWGDELYSSSNYQNKWDGTYKGKKLPEGTYYYVLETKYGKVYKGAVNIINN
jgi:gliding motility-associated-like protein